MLAASIQLTPYLAGLLLNLKHLNETQPSARRLRAFGGREEKGEQTPWAFSSLDAEEGRVAEPRYAQNRATEAAEAATYHAPRPATLFRLAV